MKIVADNRGRIALSKLNVGYSKKDEILAGVPGSEWEVRVDGGKVVLTPTSDESKPEWIRVDSLGPEHIGQVISIHRDSIYPDALAVVGASEVGVFGTLEAVEISPDGVDVKAVKLVGLDIIRFEKYGSFFVRNV